MSHLIWIGKELSGGTDVKISRDGLTIEVDGQTKTISLQKAEELV